MTSTIEPQRAHGIGQPQRTDPSAAGSIQQLVDRRLRRLGDQLRAQVLLERLVRRARPLPEHGVRLVRDILDLNVRHGAILGHQRDHSRTHDRPA
jgi:hypothetical protein